MGWFNDQITERKNSDADALNNAFGNIAAAVLGRAPNSTGSSSQEQVQNALDEILKYYHAGKAEFPESMTDFDRQLEYVLHPRGIMYRSVTLSKGWYKNCVGALLARRTDDDSLVALIPNRFFGYSFFDAATGKRIQLNKKTEELLAEEALCFYKPFPLRSLTLKDLFTYIIQAIPVGSFVMVLAATAAVTLIGLLIPELSRIIFSEVITSGSITLLLSIAIVYTCINISQTLMNAVNSLVSSRVTMQLDLNVEAATMARVLSLPASFFKNYSSGQLSYKMNCMNSLCSMLFGSVCSTSLTSLFSLIYVAEIFRYTPSLVTPALAITAVTLIISVITAFMQMKLIKEQMYLAGKESGMTYSLISGVQKIKLAGAEKRAFSRWMNLYAKEAKLSYNPPALIRFNQAILTAISLIGTIILYNAAIVNNISVADYTAFSAAYGMISAAFTALAGIASTLAQIKPTLDEVAPLMQAEPEVAGHKRFVTRLSGGVELTNVSFRYNENMPLVLDNLSLSIRPGQYVAIVGATGCGKSTLIRLMLGFETPQKGAIYYDRNDISRLDLNSLRSRIGCVMQDGKLFFGDIYSNIAVSAPSLTLEDAWRAAEIAGMADDIRAMPMGMHTIIAEGQGGISGGQRQRLMIARAVAPKPQILILDEATSALDNVTQKKVADALAGLKCTRIVIAHRLSTIRQCDRILVLDGGKIAEDGTYDELIAKNGIFAELVERQRIDAGNKS